MIDIDDCKSLNDISLKIFGKKNYSNREKVKKLLFENDIDWKEWVLEKKKKQERFCLKCGKKLNKGQNKFCSSSCAASVNNSLRKKKEEDNKIKKRKTYYTNRKCIHCGNFLKNTQTKFCSNVCQQEYKYVNYINKWKNNQVDGVRGGDCLSRYLRKYIFEKYDNRCQKCGWGEINPYSNTVPLEIHHIDGNCLNNKEENLQLLCPNCHSLTINNKSLNKESQRNRKKYYKYIKIKQ